MILVHSFLHEWLVEVMIAALIGVSVGVLAMVGSLRQVVKNGLTERMGKAETWIEWLIQDRITEARHSGRSIVKPPSDINTDEMEMGNP